MPADDDRLKLERALLDAPDDLATWSVYADHLQQLGDPWGERLSLGLARGESSGNRYMQLHDAVVDFDRANAEAMLGEALARLLAQPGFAATVALEHRFGLVLGARVGRTWIVRGDSPENQADREYADQILDALLDGKAARLLRSLALGFCDLRSAYVRIANSGSADNLRGLAMGWEIRRASGTVASLAKLGKIDALLQALPELRELSLGGATARFDHPRVERLSLAIDTSDPTLLDALAGAKLPCLRTLELCGRAIAIASEGSVASERVAELFGEMNRRPSLAGLEQLELVGWMLGPGARVEGLLTRLGRALPGSRVRRLVLREFGRGEAAVDLLLGEAGSLEQLDRIDVEIPGLDEPGATRLRRCFGDRLNLLGWEPEVTEGTA